MAQGEAGTYETKEQAVQEIARLQKVLRRREKDLRLLEEMAANAQQLMDRQQRQLDDHCLAEGALLAHMQEMALLFDRELNFVRGGAAAQPLLRGGRDDAHKLAHLPLEQVFSSQLPADFVQALRRGAEQVLEKQAGTQRHETLTLRDGSTRHWQVSIWPVQEDDDDCEGVLLLVRDETERQGVQQQARQAAQSQARFLANMSHEIRTPMNAIKGLAELLALTHLDETQRIYLDNVLTSANLMVSILDDVMDFSKIDAGGLELSEGPYSLAELLSEASGVVSVRGDAKEVLFLVEADARLPAELWGDGVRVKQVMVNLLSNALKYTEKGHVRLTLTVQPAGDGVRLHCQVQDTGVGIREEEQDGLFDAFTRADLEQNRAILGTGLGLTIAKHLVAAMGGEISVKSVYGQGSVFSFWVPQRVIDPKPMASLAQPEALRVLLAGDKRQMENIAAMLGGLGVPCTLAGDADAEDGFTHCIYDATVSQKQLRQLKLRQPAAEFAALRNIQHALGAHEMQDTILFVPLLVMELAQWLGHKPQAGGSGAVAAQLPPATDFTVQNTRLLVVDDNAVNLMVATEMLKAFGAAVEGASGGEQALEMCEEQGYDIIFMDHMMPGVDGVEATARLRGGSGPNRQTPIVALTANVVHDTQSYYVRCGMDDYLGKPVDFSDLARVLRRWLPPDKILLSAQRSFSPPVAAPAAMADAQAPEAPSPEVERAAKWQAVATLDAFGLSASFVVQEMEGEIDGYFARLSAALPRLGGLVAELERSAGAGDGSGFAQDMLQLRDVLHDIGARQQAGDAKRLASAAREARRFAPGEDFVQFAGNVLLLEERLRVLLARVAAPTA